VATSRTRETTLRKTPRRFGTSAPSQWQYLDMSNPKVKHKSQKHKSQVARSAVDQYESQVVRSAVDRTSDSASALDAHKAAKLADVGFASTHASGTFFGTLAAEAQARTIGLDLSDPAQSQLGNYHLISKLGQGGMGVVFRAREPKLDRDVALKLLAAGVWSSPEIVARFRAEAQLAARLHHPNIVPIFEIDQVDDVVFFTMALIEGETLRDAINAKGSYIEVEAARIIRTVAEAIDYAHRLKVLHLDLKPANILLDQNGEPQVADFGLSRRLETTDLSAHEVSGTPNFMAPEQFDPTIAPLCVGTDIYGLGGVLYQMLTGTPAFMSESVPKLMQQVLHEPARDLRMVNRTLSKDMAAICAKCLEKSPDYRYPSARALADDLQRLLEKREVSVRKLGIAGRLWSWAKREPKVAAFGAIALVAMLAGTTISILQSRYAQTQQHLAESQTQLTMRERAMVIEANAASEAMSEQFMRLTMDLSQTGKPISANTLLDLLEKGIDKNSPIRAQRAKLLQLMHFTAIAGDVSRHRRIFQQLIPLMHDASRDQRDKFEKFSAFYSEPKLGDSDASSSVNRSSTGLPIAEMIALTRRISAAKTAGDTALTSKLFGEAAALLGSHADPMMKPIVLGHQILSARYRADFERANQLGIELKQQLETTGLRDGPLHRLVFHHQISPALLQGDLDSAEAQIFTVQERINAVAIDMQASGDVLNTAEIDYFQGMLAAMKGERKTAIAKLQTAKVALCAGSPSPPLSQAAQSAVNKKAYQAVRSTVDMSESCENTLFALLIVSGTSQAQAPSCTNARCQKLLALMASKNAADAHRKLFELYPLSGNGLSAYFQLNELFLLHHHLARAPLKQWIAEHVAKLDAPANLPKSSVYRRWLAQIRTNKAAPQPQN
jgi:hypothetical protein